VVAVGKVVEKFGGRKWKEENGGNLYHNTKPGVVN